MKRIATSVALLLLAAFGASCARRDPAKDAEPPADATPPAVAPAAPAAAAEPSLTSAPGRDPDADRAGAELAARLPHFAPLQDDTWAVDEFYRDERVVRLVSHRATAIAWARTFLQSEDPAARWLGLHLAAALTAGELYGLARGQFIGDTPPPKATMRHMGRTTPSPSTTTT